MKRIGLVVLLSMAAAVKAAPPPAFAVCGVCHKVSANAPASIGPNLWGIVGRKAGTAPAYSYSPAMRGSGIAWTPENLAKFIENPQLTVPGTKMPYAGQKDPVVVAQIVTYLSTLQ